MAHKQGSGGDQDQGSRRQPSNWLERLAMGLSLLLIVAAVGYLIYEGWRPKRPAAFDIRTKPPRHTEGRYYVPLTVTNTGSQSVRGLGLEVRLEEKPGGKAVEKSTVNLQWVPAQSGRKAAAAFEKDPAKYTVKVRVEGYEKP